MATPLYDTMMLPPPRRGRQFGVPFDVGQTNRVDRAVGPTYFGLPQDEPPVLIERPEISPDAMMLPPPQNMRAEAAPGDIGLGIPVDIGNQVTSVDLAPAAPESSALRALSSLGGGRFRMPAPMPSAPGRRVVGSRPEFIYTNPVAAQQAAANYAARLGAETAEERGYQDYLSRLNETQAASDRSQAIADQQAQQVRFASEEGAANRASAERIANTSETVRQQRFAEQAWAENERAAEIGEQTAGMLNSDPNARVDRKFAFLNPATGRWESRFKRQPRPTAGTGAPGISTPVATPVPPPAVAVPAAAPPTAAAAPAVPAAQVEESPSFLRRVWEAAPLNPVGIGSAVSRVLTQ